MASPTAATPPSDDAFRAAMRRRRGGARSDTFARSELRALSALCAVYGLRLLGLYMVLPVLSLYARGLEGSTPLLTGLSVGVYGFANMLLVLPFGVLSDRVGRKRAIALGLCVFAAGSVLAGATKSIAGLLAGRALQGAGAVSSVVVALVGDVTRPRVRARAMTLLGMSVGLAFMLGVVGGPALAGELGVRSLFLITGALAVGALLLVLAAVPAPRGGGRQAEFEPAAGEIRAALLQPELLKLDAGMFVIHFALTALFVVVPILLDDLLPAYHLWRVYAPVLLVGMAVAVPTMTLAEKTRSVHRVLYGGIVLFGMSFLVLRFLGDGLAGMVAGMGVFVIAFGLLEPTLTTLLTRFTTPQSRGTAAGVFSMSGFLGSFLGGATGGLLLESQGALFLVLAGLALPWLLLSLRMRGLRGVARPEPPRRADIPPGAGAD
ncbi:MAG: MFS transporter [Gemmatimonadetes bacterium]|nr:MFS transporter [Gemmatimonadota bacterium]